MAGFMYNVGVRFKGQNLVSPTLATITADTKKASHAMLAYGSAAKNALGKLPKIGMRTAAIVGATTALYGAQAAMRGIVSETARFQVSQLKFGQLLGDRAAGAAKTLELFELAAKTPFEFKNLQSMSIQLLAFGETAKGLLPTLRLLGDATLGDPEKTQQVVEAYGKVMARGRATQRELNMFITAGIPIMRELGAVTGKTGNDLTRFIRAGKVGFPVLRRAFENMAGEGGSRFGAMQLQMETLSGQWSNFQDILGLTAVTLGDTFKGPLTEVVRQLAELMRRTQDWIKANQTMLTQNIGGFFLRVSEAIKRIDPGKLIMGLAHIAKWGLRVFKIFVVWSGAVSILQAVAAAVQIVGAAGATAGALATAAWAPFLVIILAVLAVMGALWWLMQKFTDLPDISSLTGMDALTAGSDFSGLDSFGGDPVAMENRNALMSTEQTINRNNNSVNSIELITPEGYSAAPADGARVPGFSTRALNTGEQLYHA